MDGKGCIYLITCSESGKRYVGQYVKPNPKGRWSSHISKAKKGCKFLLHQAIRKYGDDSFTLETLCICPKESLGNMEAYWAEQLETYCWDSPGGYNMVWCGNQPRLGMKNTPEMIAKSSAARKGQKQSPEAKERQRITMTGRKLSPEALEAHHKAHLGRKKTPEELEKLRIANTGRKQTPEIIAKALKNRSPTVYTDEIREKLRLAQLGRKHTEEARKKMSESQIGRKHSEETLNKIHEYSNSKERKDIVSKQFKGKQKSPEQIQKMSEARKAYWARKRERDALATPLTPAPAAPPDTP